MFRSRQHGLVLDHERDRHEEWGREQLPVVPDEPYLVWLLDPGTRILEVLALEEARWVIQATFGHAIRPSRAVAPSWSRPISRGAQKPEGHSEDPDLAGATSVLLKSCPVYSSGSPITLASAYEKQSP